MAAVSGEDLTSVAPHQDGTAAPSSVASCRAAGTAVNTMNSRSPNSSFVRVSACHRIRSAEGGSHTLEGTL